MRVWVALLPALSAAFSVALPQQYGYTASASMNSAYPLGVITNPTYTSGFTNPTFTSGLNNPAFTSGTLRVAAVPQPQLSPLYPVMTQNGIQPSYITLQLVQQPGSTQLQLQAQIVPSQSTPQQTLSQSQSRSMSQTVQSPQVITLQQQVRSSSFASLPTPPPTGERNSPFGGQNPFGPN